MNTVILSEHKKRLLQRQSNLNLSLEKIKVEIEETSKTQTRFLVDFLDHAKEQSDLSALFEMNQQYMKEQTDIAIALDRIEKGTFGKCLECGDLISTKRILAQPSACCCLECQEQKEEYIGLEIDQFKKQLKVA